MPEDGDIYRAALEIEMPDLQLGANVYYWRVSDPNTEEPPNVDLMGTIQDELQAMMGDIDQETSDAYNYGDCYVDRITWNGTNWETVEDLGSTPVNVPGTDTGDACPHAVAAVLTAPTDKPKTRARKFFPGVIETKYEDSTLAASLVTALATLAAKWLDGRDILNTVAATIVPGVVTKLGLWEPIVEVIVNTIAGSQRRRKPGVGT